MIGTGFVPSPNVCRVGVKQRASVSTTGVSETRPGNIEYPKFLGTAPTAIQVMVALAGRVEHTVLKAEGGSGTVDFVQLLGTSASRWPCAWPALWGAALWSIVLSQHDAKTITPEARLRACCWGAMTTDSRGMGVI